MHKSGHSMQILGILGQQRSVSFLPNCSASNYRPRTTAAFYLTSMSLLSASHKNLRILTPDSSKGSVTSFVQPGDDKILESIDIIHQRLNDSNLVCSEARKEGGRGLFARKNFKPGEIVLKDEPFVWHPALENVNEVCNHCLKGLFTPSPGHCDKEQRKFCSQSCKDKAEHTYLKVESKAAFDAFDKHAFMHEDRFMLLVKRLFCMALQKPSASTLEELDHLKPDGLEIEEDNPNVPPRLREAAGLLQAACQEYYEYQCADSKASDKSIFLLIIKKLSLERFCNLHTKLSANAYRAGLTAGHVFCMMPKHEVKYHGMQKLKLICSPTGRLPGFKPDSEHHSHGPTRVTIGDTTFGELGTALYLTGSFINHSCCPNLVDTYPENNGEIAFVALRDIEAGEQLFSSYIIPDLPRQQRQAQLWKEYGFKCYCDKCKEESWPGHITKRLFKGWE